MSVRWLFKMASKINSFFVVVLGLPLLDVYEMKKPKVKRAKNSHRNARERTVQVQEEKGFHTLRERDRVGQEGRAEGRKVKIGELIEHEEAE